MARRTRGHDDQWMSWLALVTYCQGAAKANGEPERWVEYMQQLYSTAVSVEDKARDGFYIDPSYRSIKFTE